MTKTITDKKDRTVEVEKIGRGMVLVREIFGERHEVRLNAEEIEKVGRIVKETLK